MDKPFYLQSSSSYLTLVHRVPRAMPLVAQEGFSKGYPSKGFPLIGSYLFVFLFLWCLPFGQTLSKRSIEYNALFLAAFAHFCPYRKEGPARPERKGRILQ